MCVQTAEVVATLRPGPGIDRRSSKSIGAAAGRMHKRESHAVAAGRL